MHRRYLARRSGNAQAHLPSASRISHFFDGLWSGLGQTQAHDSRVFGASQSPDQGAVYACAPPIHLGRAGAHTLASRGCQAGLRVSQVAGVSGSIARVQSPHQAVSNRCPRPPGVSEDSQDAGALARHPGPMRAADCHHVLVRFASGVPRLS